MLIIDAQVHLWAADRPDRPWPRNRGAVPHRPTPFLEADLLAAMAGAGVDRAVIVPPSWEGDRNDLALAAAERHPAASG
jgi:predicted TIM-barrel fold metal-dependent hydrolase